MGEWLKKYEWKPGQSGNPAGRPKRLSFEAIVAGVLDEVVPGTDQTKREALARVFVNEMLKRNGAMIREFMLRTWPVIQRHEVKTDGGLDAAHLEREIAAVASQGNGRDPEPERKDGSNGSGV
jgi:hypothetical protein